MIKRVELGAGMRTPEGSIGIDIRPFKGIDYVLDIGKDPLPFRSGTIDEIHADNLYEHLTADQLFFSMDECFRVLKPMGFLYIKVPIYGTQAWLIHPDHKMHWNRNMVGFFEVPDNEGHIDPHGYLKGFWHHEFIEDENKPEESLWFKMYPNKPNGRFPYFKVKRASGRWEEAMRRRNNE